MTPLQRKVESVAQALQADGVPPLDALARALEQVAAAAPFGPERAALFQRAARLRGHLPEV